VNYPKTIKKNHVYVCKEVEVADILIHGFWVVDVLYVSRATTTPDLSRKLIAV